MSATNNALTVVKGQAQDEGDVERAFANMSCATLTVVVVTLNNVRQSVRKTTIIANAHA